MNNNLRLNLKNYTLIRAVNPFNSRRDGVSDFFKEHLNVRSVNSRNLNKCLALDIHIYNKKEFVISSYLSPSQSKEEFDLSLLNFRQLIFDTLSQNPLFIVAGNFKVRLSSWQKNYLTTTEGSQVESVTSSYGLSQLIRGPTHILSNLPLSIDLIFVNQTNLIIVAVVSTYLCTLIVPIKWFNPNGT